MENNHPYAKIITTIALAAFALFWTTVDGRLKALEIRLRAVENQITAISTTLGIDQSALNNSQKGPARPSAAARLNDPGIPGPITP